jgi:endonuclease/exonuclease/phosphatase (EEP) superfamily protein YafD
MNRARVRESISLTAFAAAMLISLPLLAGFFGSVHSALDSLAHFRVHLAVSMILFSLLSLVGSMWRQGLAAIAFGLAAIGTALGAQFHPGPEPAHAAFQPEDESRPVYRLLQLNLRFDNPEPARVLSMIGRERPDILTLNEVSALWREKLDLLASYPHRVVCKVANRSGGVAILSLRPFTPGGAPQCLDGGTFALATVDFGGRPVQIGALHLHRPWPFPQSFQIGELEPLLADMSPTAILAGDLNATPWSHAAKRIARAGPFRPFPLASPTWLYRRLPEALRFAGLPIDRVYAKGGVTPHAARTLEAVGSDHLPVLVEFSLDDAGGAPEIGPASAIVVRRATAAREG